MWNYIFNLTIKKEIIKLFNFNDIFKMLSLNQTFDESLNQSFLFQGFEFQEYFLLKNNTIYKFEVKKRKDEILINYKNYAISLNNSDFEMLTNLKCETIDKAYTYIINLFDEGQVKIKNIYKKEMILLFNINRKEREFILSYNELNKNCNLLNELYDNYKELKNEIDFLKKEIKKYKIDNNENNQIFEEMNPSEIKYSINLTYNSFAPNALDNEFTVFQSIEKLVYLIYSNDSSSIIAYNLNNNKIIKKIKKAHEKYISNLRHYLDKINNRDIIMSISCQDCNIKLWNAYNWECLINIENIYKNGELDSACFLLENDINYIVTCHDEEDSSKSENIKVYDFFGNNIKEIDNSNDISYFIDSYYDESFFTNYIITSNNGYIKSYDFNRNKLYRTYCDKEQRGHFSFIINNENGIVKIIESICDGQIRIWDFKRGYLLNRIKVSDYRVFGICLWNEKYLFVGCEDTKIKLIDLKNGKIINELTGHSKDVITIKLINHPKYGKCLISQGLEEDQIKLWTNSKGYSNYLCK